MKHLPWKAGLAALILSCLLSVGIEQWVVSNELTQFQDHVQRRAAHLADGREKAGALGVVMATSTIDPTILATAQGTLPPDNPAVITVLSKLFKMFNLGNMIILNREGIVTGYVVAPDKPSITGKNFSWRPYFTGALAGSPTMYAALGNSTRERGFYVSAPITGDMTEAGTPEIHGVIVAKLGFEEIDQLLSTEKKPMAVLSPEGVIFASNVADWRYQVLGSNAQVEAALKDKRVNTAYEKTPPVLLKLTEGWIEKEGRRLQMVSSPIQWNDPTGLWTLAGFDDPTQHFGWIERAGTGGGSFLVLMLLVAWWQARQNAKRKTKQVVSLLDNSGQGFLSFGPDLVIESEYSRACEVMLGNSPAGLNVADLLFGAESPQASLLKEILPCVLNEQDDDIRASMMSLLPKEILRTPLLLKVEYKPLGHNNHGKFMVVLTDMTEERRVTDALAVEQAHLKMIVASISDNRNFFETVDAFQEFLGQRLACLLGGKGTPALIAKELYREIYTFKGLLNQFSFPTTPKVLHDIESRLSLLLSQVPTQPMMMECLSRPLLQEAFDADMSVLSESLGDAFLTQGRNLMLTDDQARQLEVLSRQLLRGEPIDTGIVEVRHLLDEIVNLRNICLSDALHGFDKLVQQIAQRLEKEVAPLVIHGGDDLWIDPQSYKAFLQSLVHIFRNAVTHGLETMETRWEADKEEMGHITCTLTSDASGIHITIADDGAGLNLQALREKAVANGIYSEEAVRNIDDETIARLIFMDNISTQKEITDLAGRGVGLAAVLSETEKLGGNVVVKTKAGQGTEFHFTLPAQHHV
ncbi:MAG: ATP-binding protein [Rhodocyclaceae bacterium]|nr:ATP-binding protein [Rhodocyclaceae bacterium]